MTTQQQDLERINAWDRYQKAQRSFLAAKSFVQRWEGTFKMLHEKMRFHLFELSDTDFARIPTSEAISNGLTDLRAARLELERARAEAKQWGFPVNDDDLTYSPTT